MFEEIRFEDLLKSLRVKKGKVWTQAKTAQLLGVSLRTYVAWENGESLPSNRDLKKVAVTFELNDADADAFFRTASQVAPEIHNLPFSQNPFFTGRETLLEDLGKLFEKNDSIAFTQPISISGLGGIGKTQLALQYAHHCYPKVYRTILWVNGADKVTLEASFLSLADLLQLPEKKEREVDHIVQAVKTWLERHTGWLLILDNADDLQLARSFLPTKPRGHILLTTRSQILGNIAERIEIEAMEPEEGLFFLLRRSGVLKNRIQLGEIATDVRNAAAQLIELLGGHPLALDQAGAYIEETGCSVPDYLERYYIHRAKLLKRRGNLAIDHPEPVAATWSVSFKRIEQMNPVAANLLRLCACFHPDEIPEQFFAEGPSDLDPKLQAISGDLMALDEVLEILRSYSFVRRTSEIKALSVHRLVQVVLKDEMSEDQQRQWAEQAVRIVGHAFPSANSGFEEWARCQRYLPQAQTSVALITQWKLASFHAAGLLNKLGSYLRVRAQYKEAEALHQRALTMLEQTPGPDHPGKDILLSGLAAVYSDQGKYAQAETLLERAQILYEQRLDPEHDHVINNLNNLAQVYSSQGRYDQAIALYLRVIVTYERIYGTTDSRIAHALGGLAGSYLKQGRYEEAEASYKRALAIDEQVLGARNPSTALAQHNLAFLYLKQGRYELAEPLSQYALATLEQVFDSEHPYVQSASKRRADILREMKHGKPGKHIECPIEITLQEAYVGTTRTFNIQSTEVCLVCQGTGEIAGKICTNCSGKGFVARNKRIRVKIPAGVDNGSTIRVVGEGELSINGGPRGNLHLVISVKLDPLFERKGVDLYIDIYVERTVATQGGEVVVPTPDERKLLMKLPPRTLDNHIFRLKEQGIPSLQNTNRGHLYARVKLIERIIES